MNVSKINIFNVNGLGVSSFGGDTPAVDNNSEYGQEHDDRATKFLKGAGVVSAVILATALAGRYGVFSRITKPKPEPENIKPLQEDIKETIEEIFANKKPVKQIPAKVIVKEVPVEISRTERLKQREIDLEKYKSHIDYSPYAKCDTPEKKKKFICDVNWQFEHMSYYYQWEAFPFYMNFIKNLDPEEVNPSFMSSYGLKRNNFDRFMNKILEFIDENPQYKTTFAPVKLRFANNYINYSKYADKLDKELRDVIFPPIVEGKYNNTYYSAPFFTNSINMIARMPQEEQVGEFKKYLEFLKFIGIDRVKNSILFVLGKFAGENNIKMAEEAIQFAKKNPEFNDTIVNNLIAYEPDRNFETELLSNRFGNIKKDKKNKEIKAYTEQYNRHVDNIIKIRKMLTDSGLKCDERTRLKNRQDWFNINKPSINKYTLGFQYSPKIADIRYAAFEYDMKQGITKEEANVLIEHLTALNKTANELLTEKILGINLEDAVKIINQSIISESA